MFDRFTRGFSAYPALAALTVFTVALLSTIWGCGSAFDPKSPLGKQAILDQVNLSLSKQDCTGALATLGPVYNSLNSDNKVRMLMASAYGCSAHINFFTLLGDLANNASSLVGSGFWQFAALEFPSTVNDRVAESAQLAQDALQSAISPGAVVLPANLFNTTGFNPGALSTVDRISDANAYLFFVSIAGIGSFESRYGNPYPNGKKGNALPWTSAAAMTGDGCAYASSIVNFVDAVGSLASVTSGSLSTTLTALQSSFQTAIFAACDQGCSGVCGLAHCATCPSTLRNRTSCVTGPTAATDPSSCAAAGIVNFVNVTPVAGWITGP